MHLLAYGRKVMMEHGIVDSGDALKLGIGAMTDARWKAFYHVDGRPSASILPGLDIDRAYMTRFVDHRVGMQMRPANAKP